MLEARRAAGISQRALGIRAGTSQARVSRIENGLEEPSYERFTQLMAAVGRRPVIALEPIAQPDPAPHQLLDQLEKSAQVRFEELISMARFARELRSAS